MSKQLTRLLDEGHRLNAQPERLPALPREHPDNEVYMVAWPNSKLDVKKSIFHPAFYEREVRGDLTTLLASSCPARMHAATRG